MITILIGKSAAGKDSVLNKLIEKGYESLVLTTSRPMRNGEVNGKDYYFVSKDKFKDMIKKDLFVEYRIYQTLMDNCPDEWYYGLSKMELYKNNDNGKYVVPLDINGAKSLIKNIDNNYKVIYLDVSDTIREKRAKKRSSFDQTEWNRRMEDDKSKYSKENLDSVNAIRVLNENISLEELVNKIDEIINL